MGYSFNSINLVRTGFASQQARPMPSNLSQEFLFQRIKEILPPQASLVDAVAEVLNLSIDSAYRRIRNETPLILEEAKELCDHFKVSLDQLLSIKSNSILFRDVKISNDGYSYEKYLGDLLRNLNTINSFEEKEIIYLTKDVPLFHNFYFEPLIAFRYFFWMKIMLQHPAYINKGFELTIPTTIETLSRDLTRAYSAIPSTEIWNIESINSIISQIEFCRDSGQFSSASDIRHIYQALYETMLHLKSEVEFGCKFMPGENAQMKKKTFSFFYNRVILGETTILVRTTQAKTAYLNYDVLNYLETTDQAFCDRCYNNLQNLKKRATMISQSGEKQRNIFFGILLNKIEERQKHL
jgi:hypothetical protein